MRLKSLYLVGFKSFAQRTELTFGPGITAVVGPNGSGKSNIGDAIRWVLGEQSVRQLRGASLQDVIFSGSDRRKAQSMAEVSITFDNEDGFLPLSFSEVSVTRRVFRSGESEFFINRSPCRLRDIQELFLDTGLGRGGHSLVGQGEVDAVLSAPPEARRAMLEETAGVARYRQRREDALRQLEATEQDLVRLGDILAEVEGRLGPLAKEAERATRHAQLSEQLQAVRAALARDDVRVRQADLAQAQSVWEAAAAAEAAGQAELAAAEEELAVALAVEQEAAQAAEAARAEWVAAREAALAAEHQQEVLRLRLERVSAEQQRWAGEAQAQERQAEQLAAAADQAKQEAEKLRLLLQEAQARLAAMEVELERRKVALSEREGALARSRAAAEAAARSAAQHRQAAALAAARAQTARSRLAELSASRDASVAAQAALRAEVDEQEAQLAQAREGLTRAQAELAAAQARRTAARQAQSEASAALSAAREAWQTVRARRRALQDLEESGEGYGQAVRALLRARDQIGDGLYGPVAQLISVPEGLEVAIEVALGGAQQYLVVRSDREAEVAIAFLKERGLGRATFLPLANLRPSGLGPRELQAVQAHPVTVGVAAELVGCADLFRPAVRYLLGRTVVARELRPALELARLLPGSARLVTLAGELIVPGGPITGGGRRPGGGGAAGARDGLLTRRRELERLAVEEQQAQGRVAAAEAAAQQAEQEVKAADAALEEARAAAHRWELRIQSLQGTLQALSRRLAESERALAAAAAEAERCAQEAARQEQLQAAAEAQAQRAEREGEACRQEAERLAVAMRGEQEEREEAQRRAAEARAAVASLERQAEGANREAARLQHEAERAHQAAAAAARQAAALAQEQAKLEAERQSCRDEAGLSAQRVAGAEAAQRRATEAWEQAARARAVREEAVRAAAQRLEGAREERHRAEMARGRAEMALQRALEAWQALEPDVGADDLGPPLGAAERKRLTEQAAQLQRELDALGPVYQGAIAEYEAVLQRRDELARGRDDLIQARNQLHKVIQEIDRRAAAKLMEAYGRVRVAFQTIFARLFQGGRADLVWTGAADPLQGGLEIVVQPPGKRLQNLLALSGGERALAAIALLFALMEVRPSPFVLLDEVDAALDEANLVRFAQLLQAYADRMQLIVITHRTTTMEAASALYGVTMEGSGVSRLVSIKLDEARAYAGA